VGEQGSGGSALLAPRQLLTRVTPQEEDQGAPIRIDNLVSSLKATQAGMIVIEIALLLMLAIITIEHPLLNVGDAHSHSGAKHPKGAAYVPPTGGEAPTATAAIPGMRQATCPKCHAITNYPPEYDAVCCGSCRTVIQVGAPTGGTAVPM